MSIHPSKLMLALLLVILLWVGGHVLNFLWGPVVYPGEFGTYTVASTERFYHWLEEQQKIHVQTADSRPLAGVFETALNRQLDAFEKLVAAVTRLDLGFDQLLGRSTPDRSTVVGALYEMCVTVPGWLYRAHCFFLVCYLVWGLAVWSVVGGLCRGWRRWTPRVASRDRQVRRWGLSFRDGWSSLLPRCCR